MPSSRVITLDDLKVLAEMAYSRAFVSDDSLEAEAMHWVSLLLDQFIAATEKAEFPANG